MTRRAWDHGGRTAEQRGYGSAHRKLRKRLLAQEPLCRACKRNLATIADHVLSIAKGGAVHDIGNLQPLCSPCHDAKSAADKKHRIKRRIALDGCPADD